MTDELSPEEEKAVEGLAEAVAEDLAKGIRKEKIVKNLVKQGLPESEAMQFVGSIEREIELYKNSPAGRQEMAKKYARHMLFGFLWAAGGTIVTAATYQAASGGGTYVIAWGAILFGIIDFFWGLFGWLKYRD
jgi:hypothetical protein